MGYKIGPEAKVSLQSFVFGTLIFAFPASGFFDSVFSKEMALVLTCYIFFVFSYYFIGYSVRHQKELQIAYRGSGLGLAFGVGLILATEFDVAWQHFGWYLCCLTFFHWSEYFTQAITKPQTLTLESYLLNHSPEYKIAAVASWLEFIIEWYLMSGIKTYRWLALIGLVVTLGGEALRKLAMLTAGSNFDHYVQFEKKEGHRLVTSGVYKWFRHPSYVGWFYWSLGTQLILCNPLCFVVYAVASWRFFNTRIEVEEATLISFFGHEYITYKAQVGTGLPFIKGIKL